MKAELLKARDDRDAADLQLLYSELWCTAEAQIIKNLQRDVEDL